MKRYVIDKQRLEAMYPPMDERFERNMRAMIGTLPSRRTKRRTAVKPRYALVFALLLALLLCATALAAYVVNRGFLTDMAELHVQAGAYDDWTLEEKESIVRSMKQYGVIADTSAWDEALAVSSQKKREKALDKLFSERYGINGRTDVITASGIVEQELGLYDSEWSLEQKAAYTQLLLELDLLGYDTNIDFLPGEDDIPPEEAVRIAKEALQAAYGYDDAEMDRYDVWTSFLIHRSEMNAKKPYYMLEFVEEELSYHTVYVSGDGRVLSSEDGYRYITSPAEHAARKAADKQKAAMPKNERLAAHAAGLAQLDTKTFLRPDRIADGATALADGTAVVYGRSNLINGSGDGMFVECINAAGETEWLIELSDENGEDCMPEMAMQLDSGDLLLVMERRKSAPNNEIEYQFYEQLRIGADGAIRERKRMKTVSEMTGMRGKEHEQMFAMAGHGGMLVSGYMGGKHIPVYAQLDEQGEPMLTWQFEELLGYAPYLKVTDEGYVLTAWNEGANASMLRFYDKQGQLLYEGENVEGIRINQVKSCGDGELMVTSSFMRDGQWLLARLDDHGKQLEKMTHEDGSGPILNPTDIATVGGRYVYVANHHLSPSDGTQHTGVIISDAAGTIREYAMAQEEGEDGYFAGFIHLAPIGEDSVLLARTFMEKGTEKRTMHLSVIRIPQ